MPPSPPSSPGPASPPDLTALLRRTFGHSSFRANQQAVCEAATSGADVLLVMPTGAGKSLCYQLPAIARGGTALVISPLIALMDDQAAKLSALGLKVARIHSGLDRDQSRQACRDYLDGNLQFLFIAPERMRVPGFPQMLAKRKPALVAIDEAHCISAWGHDFRPDYRTLGEHLPSLRPAPILALTATATPNVQRDIVAQLNLQAPSLFIHGFRRHNLAIEVVEMSKPRRHEFVADLLRDPAARPAIVYAPSRKSAEDLASTLGSSAAAYHAGLDPSTRERVQTAFLTGKLDIVVATIAFGMGIDKADVRTVVHTSLPGSVEAFYQEIGRAGRDGLPARTVLLHSFADRKMHDFFLERDYPAATDLARVAKLLTEDLQPPEDLARRLRMDLDTLSNALGKLASQGAASFDIEGDVRATENQNWRSGYDAQLAFRRAQIDRMVAFAESRQCRMTALIQHFGDTDDGLRPCGHCDFCAPETSTSAATHRPPTDREQRHLRAILAALEGNGRSTGKLFTDLSLPSPYGKDRKAFDTLLDALARAGLLTLSTETFTSRDDKDAGREIAYRKATLTHEGRNPDPGDLPVTLRDPEPASATGSTRKKSTSASAKAEKEDLTSTYTPAQQQLDEILRAWRKSETATTGKPAFIIMADRTLIGIALAHPQTLSDLRRIPGIGPEKAETYGPALIALCRNSATPASALKNSSVDLASDPRPLSRRDRREAAVPSTSPARAQSSPRSHSPDQSLASRPKRSEAETPALLQSTPTFERPARPENPTTTLTPAQQLLDTRLRDWRKAESEKIGLPQFFVLGSSTLRALVLQRPRTLSELRTIDGIGPEKLDKFAAALLTVLNT